MNKPSTQQKRSSAPGDARPSQQAAGHTVAVEAEAAGARLDRFLSERIEILSRARLQELIRAGHVGRDGVPATDPSAKVRAGEVYRVRLPPAEPSDLEGEAMALTILYEDDQLIVIDKPAGLVVHPGAGNAKGTLVHALIAHCGESLSGIGGVMRPGIVHRLDKGTSGVMVAAKTDSAHRHLAAQFADHGRTGDLVREYLALVWGKPRLTSGRVETNIARHPSQRTKMASVGTGGRRAVTHYTVEESFGPAAAPLMSLVRCRLETGRTHQVRVHMAHLGTPIVGDDAYAAGFQTKMNKLPDPARHLAGLLGRQALHAAVLGFRHPKTHQLLRFESALPSDITELCQALKPGKSKMSKN